ncbi:MAG: hypothetical protein IJ946_05205 [Clostridia bacterium]|nr:hypothetical protein [Clostridia bacterium]
MKKLLSIMLTVCMLLTMVVVPVNVFATEAEEAAYEESTLGGYYKFTFSEGYDYTLNAVENYKGKDFKPFWSDKAAGKATANYKSITDAETGEVYDVLEIVSADGFADITPLTEDGQPFELTPGVPYRVKINYFNPTAELYDQSYLCVGNSAGVANKPIELAPGQIRSANYPFEVSGGLTYDGGSGILSFGFKDGTYGKSNAYNLFKNLVIGNNACAHKSDERYTYAGCSHAAATSQKVYRQESKTVTLDKSYYTYDAETKTHTANMPVYKNYGTAAYQGGKLEVTALTEKPSNWDTKWTNFYYDNGGTYTKMTTTSHPTAPEFEAGEYYRAGVATGEFVEVNNYLSLSFAGGMMSTYANHNKPLYTNYTYDEVFDADKEYCRYLIESIEVFEVGKGFANFHVGDEVTSVKGEAGEEIDFYAPAAPEGKYFVSWYTDPEFTTPVKASTRKAEGTNDQVTEYISPLFTEGVCANYYARFEDYGTYARDDFDVLKSGEKLTQFVEGTWTQSYDYDPDKNVTDTRSYVHTKAEGFEFPRYGYSYKGTYDTNTQTPSGGPTATKDDLRNHLKRAYGDDYDVTYPAGVLALFSDRTWGMPGPILIKNDDGTMFVPKPGATYNIKVKYRLLLKNSGSAGYTFTAYCYGLPLRFENASSTGDTTLGGTSGTSITASVQSKEWTEETLSITIPNKISANNVPALYIGASGIKKVPVDTNEDGTNDAYDFMVLEFDYIEVEKTKEVTFINGNSTSKVGYEKGATINYPALAANYNYDHVWSLSADEYIPAPKTAEEDITVYAYKNPVISMENMPTDGYAITPYQPSVKFVESEFVSGYKSARLYPYGVTFVTTKPNDWSEALAKSKYLYNEETDAYDIPITSEMFNDAEVQGDYAKFVNKYGYPATTNRGASNLEQTNIPVHKFENYVIRPVKSKPNGWDTYYKDYYELIDGDYVKLSVNHTEAPAFEADKYYLEQIENVSKKITFKYKFSSVDDSDLNVTPMIWPAGNIWWGEKSFNDSAIVIKSENDGWNTAVVYVQFDCEYPAYKALGRTDILLSLRFSPTSGKTYSYEAFIDDVVVEDYEVEEGNVVVTFMRYNAEKKAYEPELGQGKPGEPINVPTNNYDPKWYSVSDEMDANNIVSVYPSEATTLYNATYVQNNPVDGQGGTSVVGDGKANGGTEQEWTFENSLYDGKYALHIGDAKKQIRVNDVENYVTGTVLQQGHTYKVTFKYQATKAHSMFGFTFNSCQSDNFWSKNGTIGSITINAGEATNEWVTANAYFTADRAGTVQDETETGIDYNVQRDSWDNLFMTYTQDANEAGNDLYFADIEVTDLGNAVVEEAGASILTDAAAEKAGQQAMRFYFTYKTTDGSTIELDGKTFTVAERGFIYRNGKAAKGDTVNVMDLAAVNGTNVKKTAKSDAFNECWEYNSETGMMKFSTYVTGFKLENDDRKLEVKAYVTFTDGNGATFTIYSDSINRMVEGVGAGTDSNFNAGQ